MLLKIVAICKECYNEKYGELPTWAYGPLYRMTEDKKCCEKCSKTDFLILTTEPVKKD